MTIGESAAFLKVTERNISQLAGSKQIPAFKVGGSKRFLKVNMGSWISSGLSTIRRQEAIDKK
jgi:hypothetical protein